ncbi:MAG TPA: DUF559 domain-containing protein [Phenylobacterium sp.]
MALRSTTRIANRARSLRRALTEPEVMLWSRLKGRGHGRPVFRCQHPIGSIILDFYCPAAKLAVEVDGRTHWDDDAIEKDRRRDAWLATQGIAVTRVGAGEVCNNLGQVADGIILRAEARIAGRD